jgi:hypothetical protein
VVPSRSRCVRAAIAASQSSGCGIAFAPLK